VTVRSVFVRAARKHPGKAWWRAAGGLIGGLVALGCSGKVASGGATTDATRDSGVAVHPGPRHSSSSGDVVADDSAVYWVDATSALVRSEPGGNTKATLASSTHYDGVLSLGSRDVFWVAITAHLQVLGVPRGGGGVSVFGTSTGGPIAMVAAGDQLYYAPDEHSDAGRFSSRIAVEDVASTNDRTLSSGRAAIGLAANDDYVYATSCSRPGDGVFREPVGGGERETLVHDTYCPYSVALDERYVYYFDEVPREAAPDSPTFIFRVPLAGGVAIPIAPASVKAFTLDDRYLYVVQGAGIVRISKNGAAAPRVLASPDPKTVRGVATDSRFVYWVESGTLKAVPKPE
jgi:hypothetical protein